MLSGVLRPPWVAAAGPYWQRLEGQGVLGTVVLASCFQYAEGRRELVGLLVMVGFFFDDLWTPPNGLRDVIFWSVPVVANLPVWKGFVIENEWSDADLHL